jgi:hypothetical protein
LHQFVVPSFVDNPALLHHHDSITPFKGAEPMGYYEGSAGGIRGKDRVHQPLLEDGIDRRRGFIKDNDFWVSHQNSKCRNTLLLA